MVADGVSVPSIVTDCGVKLGVCVEDDGNVKLLILICKPEISASEAADRVGLGVDAVGEGGAVFGCVDDVLVEDA